jgi:hypothetical protein
MKLLFPIRLGAILLLAGGLLFAQEATPGSTLDSGSDTGTAPGTATSGDSGKFSGVAAKANLFRLFGASEQQFELSTQVVQEFDDNIFASSNRTSDLVTRTTLMTGFTAAARHTVFSVHYSPGYSFYRRFDGMNFLAHSFDQEISHQFSKFTSLSWSSNATYSPSRGGAPTLGSSLGSFAFALPSLEALQKGNSFTVVNISSQVGLNHQYSAHNSFAVQVTGGLNKFTPDSHNTINQTLSRKTETGGVNFSWDHSVSDSRSYGFQLTGLYLRNYGPASHEFHEAGELTFSQRLPKQFSLKLGAGPQFSIRSGILGAANGEVQPAYALDAELARNFGRSQFSIGYSRALQIGLANGSLTAHQAFLKAQRNVGRRGFANVSATYQLSDSQNNSRNLETYFVTGQVGYRISPMLILFCNVARTQQHSGGLLGNNLAFDKDQVAFGLVYDLARLLHGGVN